MNLTETDDGKWDATLKAFWRRMSLHSRSKFWDLREIPDDEMYIFRAHFATALLASPLKECDTCKGTGKHFIGFSGSEEDGNAAEFETCPECGYLDK